MDKAINQDPSQDEFVRLLASHSSRLMSFIRIITMNRQDDAEEVFQRTCVILWQKYSQFDGENFLAWACRIARYEMLKHRDSQRRVKVFGDETIEYLSADAYLVAREVGDRRTALGTCLKKLDDADKELIKHRYYDGLSVKEIAEQLGRSSYAVYRELSRIHGMLSRCIERTLAEEI
ncbi:sigma-70 family RNA polymerase sigma factor [Aporhodopirellula aestuarii]|uniref:Sigma-70 family RNA polymerase sigma factor n=1 Tax=Aporhodopirellula aestuarii TaxID=2950107 RepID=A0ABT0UAZ8_9BACT|nr:sigma-70 family RNA polymerase sigma factor [Aporhodopirellula aestuarii]MCM2374188.1 sigma-70 family RNA polymerase sigma factor [Aporhodopirellula aestuarii]